MKFNWKQFAIAIGLFLLGYFTFNSKLFAQTLEKPKVSIAVGGKNLFYYLPLTIAEQLGYFKDEGLQVEISDFAGGAKALQALVGGSADVVSGAYEHTINMQAKAQPITRLRAAGAGAADRAGGVEEDHAQLQVAGRPQGQEDRRHGAGLVDQHDGQLRAGQGRPEADRRLVHRRRRRRRRACRRCARARSTPWPTSIR